MFPKLWPSKHNVGSVRAKLAAHRLLILVLLISSLGTGALGYIGYRVTHATASQPLGQRLVYDLTLPDGRRALVYNTGIAQIYSTDRRSVMYQRFPVTPGYDQLVAGAGLPSEAQLIWDLMQGPKQSYVEGVVVVVFRSGVTATQDVVSVPTSAVRAMLGAKTAAQRHALAPHYTTDAQTNALLADLDVDRSERLLRTVSRQQLTAMHARAEVATGYALLDFSNAYRLHLVGTPVATAMTALLRAPSVVYASPDWVVTGMDTNPITLPQQVLANARTAQAAKRAGAPAPAAVDGSLPANYALTASAQSLLNAPGVNAVEAFDAIAARWGQLPGQGITITNVSLGDLDDASALGSSGSGGGAGGASAAAGSGAAVISPNGGGGGGGGGGTANPCASFVGTFGPTTTVVNGQRYLDWPSLPLIPTYTADASGHLDGQGQVCGVDPLLGEVGLDFAVMAPLPDDQQRPDARGSGFTDLLGIAPGATYRLVVPASSIPTTSDILAAFLGAANQSPRPDIITASLGFGEDAFGFPSRYLEEDPLVQALITSLVHDDGIVVVTSGGDGTRNFTNAAIGPSGGSVATQVIPPGGTPTTLSDVARSTVPSQVMDSGAIAVGGTTLDDISSAPPNDPANAALVAQHAFPETRWNGFTAFSSAFGSRLDLAAPSDNIVAFAHSFGRDASAVDVVLNGGTSASAPEVAATAAVLLQVGKLTGKPFRSPQELRDFLQRTGRPVPNVPQADVDLRVGPQVDVGNAVETLLVEAGNPLAPAVPRVAVEQRRGLGDFNSNLDSVFTTDTDPTKIDLQGPAAPTDGHLTGRNAMAWITLAPDWEGLPGETSFALTVSGQSGRSGQVVATTRWARLLPAQILAAAGLPLAATSARTITLTYAAVQGEHTLVQTTFSLTFGPAAAVGEQALSPLVPPVVDATDPNATIPVQYDLTAVSGVTQPTLVVSEPGRVNPVTGFIFHPAYTAPLAARKGTIQVPVSALPGGGIYGIGIQLGSINTGSSASTPLYSDFAYTRVAVGASARPAAPLLATSGTAAGHFLEFGYGASFQVSWDVTDVAGATGAMLEIGPAGPTPFNSGNVFDNPNGSVRDRNGVDTGSVFFTPLPGKKGTMTLNGLQAQLLPTMLQNVRILPTNSMGAAGEASGVSTIEMDGVAPSGGGSALYATFSGSNSAFGINRHGSDGLLPSIATTASGDEITSVETFDQTTNAVTGALAPATGSNGLYMTPGAGVYGKDIGMYGVFDADPNSPTVGQTSFSSVNPLAGGGTTGGWTPPLQQPFDFYLGAMNQDTNTVAFLTQAPTPSGDFAWQAFASNLATNTAGPVYNLNDAVADAGYQAPSFNGIGQNTATNTAVLAGFDDPEGLTTCSQPTMVTIGLESGQIGTFAGVGDGRPEGLAVDSRTNTAYVPMDSRACGDQLTAPGLGIYDLTTQTGRLVPLPIEFTVGVSVDEEHGLIFDLGFQDTASNLDNNPLNALVVMKEDGTIVQQVKRFNLWDVFTPTFAHLLQVNPTSRMGYTYGAVGQQLEPFSY